MGLKTETVSVITLIKAVVCLSKTMAERVGVIQN